MSSFFPDLSLHVKNALHSVQNARDDVKYKPNQQKDIPNSEFESPLKFPIVRDILW